MTEPRSEVPEMDLVLPGSWWSIDLANDDASRRSVRALVEKVLGTDDRLARQRAELRTSTENLAAKAREGKATDLYIALELVPGLNLPMSLTVFWPEQPVLGSKPSTPRSVIDLVREGLSAQPGANEYTDEIVEDLGETSTWRRCTLFANPAHDDVPAFDNLIVDYWIAVPGTQRVVLLTFSTPFVQEKEKMLELFRAMVALTKWRDRTPSPERAAVASPS
ncbi:hypothetical protein ACX9R5_06600 [Rathayibacter sp. CAU 1779]